MQCNKNIFYRNFHVNFQIFIDSLIFTTVWQLEMYIIFFLFCEDSIFLVESGKKPTSLMDDSLILFATGVTEVACAYF